MQKHKKLKSKLKDKAIDTLRKGDELSQRHYPQPAIKPVYNNRVVFGAGFVTGAVITLWLVLFFLQFIPMVTR